MVNRWVVDDDGSLILKKKLSLRSTTSYRRKDRRRVDDGYFPFHREGNKKFEKEDFKKIFVILLLRSRSSKMSIDD